jgi:hypothetical protein
MRRRPLSGALELPLSAHRLQLQLVRITIPRHHCHQRRIFAKREFSGWDSATTPEHAEDWLAATRAQWRQVTRVNWFEAQEFCRRFSKRMGKTHTLTSAADIAPP